MYTLDIETLTFKHQEYENGKVAPSQRNSHTLSKGKEGFAYLYGGGSEDGPRGDVLRLNLDTLEFTNVKVSEQGSVKLPAVEMHRAHVL